MKITQLTALDEEDYRSALQVKIETDVSEHTLRFMDGEPEDANLSRDFSDCHSIKDALAAAYEAGKRGEPIEVIEKDEDFDEI